jgi:hypothetical protein
VNALTRPQKRTKKPLSRLDHNRQREPITSDYMTTEYPTIVDTSRSKSTCAMSLTDIVGPTGRGVARPSLVRPYGQAPIPTSESTYGIGTRLGNFGIGQLLPPQSYNPNDRQGSNIDGHHYRDRVSRTYNRGQESQGNDFNNGAAYHRC